MARLHDLKLIDVENALWGVSTSLWFNGCPHRCVGCWNSETWEKDSSLERSNEDIIEETLLGLDYLDLPKDLSLLGGDPLAPENLDDLLEILKGVKEARPKTKVLCWSGYRYEALRSKKQKAVMEYIDVIIDGRFIEALKIEGKMYGSSNQRIIDVKETEKQGSIVEIIL